MLNRGIRIRRKIKILVCHNNRSFFLTPTVLPTTVKGKTTAEEPNTVGRYRRHLQYNLYIETVFIAMASFHVSKIEWRLEEGWFRPSLDSGQLRPRSRDLEGCYWPLSRINAVRYDPARIPKSTIQEKAMGVWIKNLIILQQLFYGSTKRINVVILFQNRTGKNARPLLERQGFAILPGYR